MANQLTGQVRMREQKRLFKPSVLVVQVEERRTGIEYDWVGSGREYDFLVWRDATVADFAILKAIQL